MQFQTVTKLLAIVGACALVYVTGEWLAFRGPLHKKAEPTPSTPMQEQPLRPTFYCEKVPKFWNNTRVCYANWVHKPPYGYFEQLTAHCYYYPSARYKDGFFDISQPDGTLASVCFPTRVECLKARLTFSASMSDVSNCIEVEPDEATE